MFNKLKKKLKLLNILIIGICRLVKKNKELFISLDVYEYPLKCNNLTFNIISLTVAKAIIKQKLYYL